MIRVSPAVDHDARAVACRNVTVVVERERVRPPAELWMAWAFGLGSTCFLIGPIPVYAALVGPRADAITFFVGSILFTAGGGLQSWLAGPRRAVDRPGGRPGGPRSSSPWGRCSSTSRRSGPCRSPCPSRLRPARLASGRVRVDLLPRLRGHRLPGLRPARLATQAGRPGLVAAGRQPARLHLLRHRRGGRLCRGLQHVGARPGHGQRHDLRRRRLLPRLRRRHGPGTPQAQTVTQPTADSGPRARAGPRGREWVEPDRGVPAVDERPSVPGSAARAADAGAAEG